METTQRSAVARMATELFFEVIERRIGMVRRRLASFFARFSQEREMDRAVRRDLFGIDGEAVQSRSIQDIRFSNAPISPFLW